MSTMVIRTCLQTGRDGVVHCWVSLPYASQLVDHVKYLEPGEVKPLEEDTERRRYRHRGPTLRSLVKLVLACESAEELGKRPRRRYVRKARLHGSDKGRAHRDDAELDQVIGKA